MKEFRLSTSADRVTGISIAAATIVCLVCWFLLCVISWA